MSSFSTQPELLIFILLASAAVTFLRAYAERSERGRDLARRMYSDSSWPQPTRNLVPLAPLWVAMLLAFGVALVVPRSAAPWPVLVAFVIGTVAFVLAYRVPAPFLPRWLREDIASGKVPPATPTRGDWLLFWLVLPFAVLAVVTVPVLIFVFPVH
jgi:hypothetical protein